MRHLATLTLTALLGLTLSGCKDKTADNSSSSSSGGETVQAAKPTNPLVARAQEAFNTNGNKGRACLTFDMSGRVGATEQNESVDYSRENSNLPAYKQWVYLAKRGVAMQQTKTLDGRTYDTFTPKRDLKEEEGQGIYVPDGRYLSYCYGRWTVTDAEKYAGSEFQVPNTDYEAVMATFHLTDAPEWATSDPNANVLNQLNGTSENYGSLQGAYNELNKAVPARLNAPNRVPLAVLKN